MKSYIYQIHKRESLEFAKCRDHFAIEGNVFCIADGTTQGFNSGSWANLLCNHFKNIEINSSKDLLDNIGFLIDKFNAEEIPESDNKGIAFIQQKSKLDGGSSTFLQVSVQGKSVKVVSFGDCNFFLLKNRTPIITFPYSNAEKIDNNRNFIKSNINPPDLEVKEFFNENLLVSHFEINDSDFIIMASDALAKYFLNFPEKISDFLLVTNFEELLSLVSKLWDSKYLEEDDLTLVAINLIENGNSIIVTPPIDFSFPPADAPLFIPSSDYQSEFVESSGKTPNVSKRIYELERELNRARNLLNEQRKIVEDFQAKFKISIGVSFMLLFITIFTLGYSFWGETVIVNLKKIRQDIEEMGGEKKGKTDPLQFKNPNIENNSEQKIDNDSGSKPKNVVKITPIEARIPAEQNSKQKKNNILDSNKFAIKEDVNNRPKDVKKSNTGEVKPIVDTAIEKL
jgi:serine/threonine protein phosphatase PrpC